MFDMARGWKRSPRKTWWTSVEAVASTSCAPTGRATPYTATARRHSWCSTALRKATASPRPAATQGCIEASGNDRVWYLDKLCQKYGVTDAKELVEWVAEVEAPESARLDDEERKELSVLHEKLEEALGIDSPAIREKRLKAIAKETGFAIAASRNKRPRN